MSSISSFFSFLFSTIVWLMGLTVIGAIVAYYINKPLLIKVLTYILNIVSSDIEKATNKGGHGSKRVKSSSVNDNSQPKDELKQALMKIKELENERQLMRGEIEEKDETVRRLREQLMAVNQELFNLKNKISNEERVYNRDRNIERRDSINQHPYLYAYAPTATSPYGFNKEDWEPHENGHFFVMVKTSNSIASFSLNENCPDSTILNSLAYYSRLIDYDDYTNGGNSSRIEVVDKGSLRLVGDVWTIENKIKIKIL